MFKELLVAIAQAERFLEASITLAYSCAEEEDDEAKSAVYEEIEEGMQQALASLHARRNAIYASMRANNIPIDGEVRDN